MHDHDYDPLPDPGRWVDDAACKDVDTDVFFPDRGGKAGPAKLMCYACAAKAECLDYALTNNIKYGIWGGVGEGSRRKMRRDRNKVEPRVCVWCGDTFRSPYLTRKCCSVECTEARDTAAGHPGRNHTRRTA